MENGQTTTQHGADGGESPTVPIPFGHRRNLSGGSGLLSKLPFMRSHSDDPETHTPLSHGSLDHDRSGVGALATAMRQQPKSRKRKGSLRKTALLGTGKLRMEKRTSISSTMEGNSHAEDISHRENSLHADSPPPLDLSNDTHHGYTSSTTYDSTTSEWALPPPAAPNLTIDTSDRSHHSPPSTNASPITSPLSNYASTTDDDDGLTFGTIPPITNASSLLRRHSSRSTHLKPPSLVPTAVSQVEHDYSETEWWGWIILLTTWLVFVVGMGSVLGVWSWAWDVGETPYAPPELEDDPTLPIVGYYPALIILTGVMAWVWVVVAWVGMKYFRHARFVDGEELPG